MKKFCWPKKDIPIMFINTNNKTTYSYNLINMNKYINKNIKNNNNIMNEYYLN